MMESDIVSAPAKWPIVDVLVCPDFDGYNDRIL